MSTERHNALPARASASTILGRVAWPLLLFSVVLTGVLGLSWMQLLPRYARVEVNGVARSPRELLQYKADLLERIETQEDQRRSLVLPVHEPEYERLKRQRTSRIPLQELEEKLRAHAGTIGDDVLYFSAFRYNPDEQTLAVEGDVRNAGTSSMTVLAQYVASLKKQPFVASATTPLFTREEDKTIGMHSPFAITITLQ